MKESVGSLVANSFFSNTAAASGKTKRSAGRGHVLMVTNLSFLESEEKLPKKNFWRLNNFTLATRCGGSDAVRTHSCAICHNAAFFLHIVDVEFDIRWDAVKVAMTPYFIKKGELSKGAVAFSSSFYRMPVCCNESIVPYTRSDSKIEMDALTIQSCC